MGDTRDDSAKTAADSTPSPQTYRPDEAAGDAATPESRPREIGGRKGPEPTRYGDWEKNGRCIDF